MVIGNGEILSFSGWSLGDGRRFPLPSHPASIMGWMAQSFEILEHTADVGFRAWGGTVGELFANAARAMMAIATDGDPVWDTDGRVIEVDGEDYPSLLVNWLSELVYLFDSDEFVAGRIEIASIFSTHLKARLSGEARDPARHRWKLIVKAVTYHGLEVKQARGRWEARVFLDI
jgi:SHS2 domain-containing protein